MTGDLGYWLVGLGTVVTMVAMIYLCWRALFGDREKGTRRCPRCWHNLSATPGRTCGECGFVASREMQLHRTRRRWWLAGLAVAGSLVVAATVQERISSRGWASIVPTKALIVALPLLEGPGGELFGELVGRVNRGELSEGELDMLLDRCVGGEPGARPSSPSWQSKYGSLLANWKGRLAYTSAQKAKLRELPPWINATARPTWPADAEPVVSIQILDWWPDDADVLVRARPRIDGATEVAFRRTGRFRPPPFALAVPMPLPLAPGRHEIVVDLRLERRFAASGPWEPLDDRIVTLDLDVVGRVADFLPPVSAPELDAAVRSVFGGWVRWEQGVTPVRVNVDRRATQIRGFDDVAIGARVELLCGGRLARQLDMWWIGGRASSPGNAGWDTVYENLDLLRRADDPGLGWEMRVTGDPSLALRAQGGSACWIGSFTVPIRLIERSGAVAPDVPWERGDAAH